MQPQQPPIHPQQQVMPPPQPAMQLQSQPSQPQVIVIPTSSGTDYKENYAATTSKVLGLIQIIGGILAVVFQAIVTGLGSVAMYGAGGFWCGIMFILAGSFGYTAGKYKSRCLIVTYMVLAIIAAVFSMGIVGSSSAGLAADKYELKWQHYSYHYDYYPHYPHYNDYMFEDDEMTNGTTMPTPLAVPAEVADARPPDATEWHNFWWSTIAFNALLLLVWFVELVTLIWGSVLGCKVMCCCRKSQPMVFPVQYTNGQAFIVMGGHNQGNFYPQTSYMTPMAAPYNPVSTAGDAPALGEKHSVPDSPPPGYA